MWENATISKEVKKLHVLYWNVKKRTYHDLKTQNRNKVLKDEFSISHGEIDPEKASVTVPLLTKQKTLLGAISVSGHVSNFNKTNTYNFLSILKNSRLKLEKQI